MNDSSATITEFTVEDTVYTVSWYVEPAQRGGHTDPSWDAYPDMDPDSIACNGVLVVADAATVRAAEAAVQAAFDGASDYPDDDGFEGYDDDAAGGQQA